MAGTCAERVKRPWSTPAGKPTPCINCTPSSASQSDASHGSSRSSWKRLRVILLGDSGVGKTTLMHRFASGSFDPLVKTTVTAPEMEKKVRVDGHRYSLRLIDTAGQERFQSLRGNFYRGTNVCLLTFGLDSIASFCNLTTWRAEFMAYSDIPRNAEFPFVVVGNKADIPENRRAVSDINARAWCAANGDAPYVEASAKDGLNVEEVFQAGIRRYLEFEGQVEVRLKQEQTREANCRPRSSVKAGGQGRRSTRSETVVLRSEDMITDMVVLEEKKKCCSG